MEEIIAKPSVNKPYRCAELSKKHHTTFKPAPPFYSEEQKNEHTNIKWRKCSGRDNTL